jgi:hypothetical protein
MRNRHNIDTNQLASMANGVLGAHELLVMGSTKKMAEAEFPKL